MLYFVFFYFIDIDNAVKNSYNFSSLIIFGLIVLQHYLKYNVFNLPVFWLWEYLIKVIPETRRPSSLN